MTGHFFAIGTPEELEFKSYGSEGRELAKWKFGYNRLQTFSETCIKILRDCDGQIMASGEFREREYEGKTYTDWHVTAVTAWGKHVKAKPVPAVIPQEDDSNLPF